MDVVWRVDLGESDASSFVAEFEIDNAVLTSESSFNVPIGEASTAETLSELISAFLTRREDALAHLSRISEESELDVALYVGPDIPLSVGLSADMLRSLASAGIALRVTRYPTGD